MNGKTARYLRRLAIQLTIDALEQLEEGEIASRPADLELIAYRKFYKEVKKARTKKVLDKQNMFSILANPNKYGYLLRAPVM